MHATETVESFPYRPSSYSDLADFLPCVIYECTPSWKLTYVSPNIVELIGVAAHELLAEGRSLSQEVLECDRDLLQHALDEVELRGSAHLIHRFIDRSGLPIWVHHRLQQCPARQDRIRGCLLRLPEALRFQNSDCGGVEPFVHKLANHFTLLQMVVNSLKKQLPGSREAQVLGETIDRAVELTRGFANYHQQPIEGSGPASFTEILDGAQRRVQSAAIEKGIAWEEFIDEPARNAFLNGDFLLELALGHILQNAIEASAPGDRIIIRAEVCCGSLPGKRINIRIIDFGAGIEPEHLRSVFQLFFTTKEQHQGLGLALARRYVEVHGGFVTLTSRCGKGTQVDIHLPADTKKSDLVFAA